MITSFQGILEGMMSDELTADLFNLIPPSDQQSWNAVPMRVSDDAKAVADFDLTKILQILKNNVQAPSVRAKIDLSDRFPSACYIDTIYEKAIEEYKSQLIAAIKEDAQRYKEQSDEHKYTYIKLNGITSLGGAATGARIGSMAGSGGAIAGASIGFVAGAILGSTLGSKGISLYLATRASVNRIKCLYTIDTLEKKRISQTKSYLQLRINTLAREITALAAANQVDLTKQDEHDQLELILMKL